MLSQDLTVTRAPSRGEEIANCVSHGVGLLGSLVAAPFLLLAPWRRGDGWSFAGSCVFVSSMVLLYLASTLYHALPQGRARRVFRTLDHGAIYLLIAGTYTPFTLGVLRGTWGWTLFGLVWGLALAGLALEALLRERSARFSTVLCLVMGWLMVVAIRPLSVQMPPAGLAWLLAGGLAYTGGVVFYVARRLRYSHLVWHLFVLAGTGCHALAVLWYAA